MTDIQELLDAKDLLKHEGVIAAYWGLLGEPKDHWRHISDYMTCVKCKSTLIRDCPGGMLRWEGHCLVPDPIPGSLADVAESMRIALVTNHPHLIETYIKQLWILAKEPAEMAELIYLGPDNKIRAAVVAWTAQK